MKNVYLRYAFIEICPCIFSHSDYQQEKSSKLWKKKITILINFNRNFIYTEIWIKPQIYFQHLPCFHPSVFNHARGIYVMFMAQHCSSFYRGLIEKCLWLIMCNGLEVLSDLLWLQIPRCLTFSVLNWKKISPFIIDTIIKMPLLIFYY